MPGHVIVGLGNPGEEYQATRHNVGFMVVDLLAGKLGKAIDDRKYGALASRGRIGEHEVVLVKPQGYMNLSGEPVRKAVSDADLPLEDWKEKLIVVHDELDLPLGRIKVQSCRGSGGHKGVASIISALGTEGFARVRVGIDKPPRNSTVDWVLTPFPKADRELVETTLARAVEAVETIVLEGVEAAARKFNS